MFTLFATTISLVGTFIFILIVYGYGIAHAGFWILIIPFFLPWLVAIVTLLTGVIVIRKLQVGSKRTIEIIFTSTILLITTFYIVLPIVAKKIDRSNLEKRKAGIVVNNIYDKPTTTKQGNLSGFKIDFDVTFPEDGVYSIMTPAEDPKEINFVNVYQSDTDMVTPQPIDKGKAHYLYKAGVVYHVEALFVPGFLMSINGAPGCLAIDSEDKNGYLYRYSQITKEEAKKIVNTQEPLPRKITIIIGSEGKDLLSEYAHTNYVTSNTYRLKDFYEAALKEGAQPCS